MILELDDDFGLMVAMFALFKSRVTFDISYSLVNNMKAICFLTSCPR